MTLDDSSSDDSAQPDHIVYRRRSSHHVHRHHRSRSNSMGATKEEITRSEDKQALAFILPALVLAIGVALWFYANQYHFSHNLPQGLISLSYWLMGGGGTVLLLVFIHASFLYVANARKVRARRMETDDMPPGFVYRRRSSHHVHRHHHAESIDEDDN
ncbi:MAG: hypothetical protein ACI4QT_01475 [Kiritimatiellia bacterium]